MGRRRIRVFPRPPATAESFVHPKFSQRPCIANCPSEVFSAAVHSPYKPTSMAQAADTYAGAPQTQGRLLSLKSVGFGWATLVGASIGWSLYNPAHRSLRFSQRVIHARIHAQIATIGALGAAAAVETYVNKEKGVSLAERNVTIVTPVRKQEAPFVANAMQHADSGGMKVTFK